MAKTTRKTLGRRPKAPPAKKPPSRLQLTDAHRELIHRLSDRKVVGQRLFLSVDGRPEIEVDRTEFILGSAEGVDLRLDLPLISLRHARILWKSGRPVFEDLRSARGSYRLGQPVDVRMIETGDEIDLGGFLPIRFRLADAIA